MGHITELLVRTYECDAYNHVNNAVYLNYLEHARMQFLHDIGFNYKGAVAAGINMYVTEINIKYKASAVLDDILLIETKHTKFGKISGQFSQCIRKDDETVCAEATVKWGCVDAKTGRPTKFPDEFFVPGLEPEAI